MVKCELKIMFVNVLEWNQNHSDNIWRCQIRAPAILDFLEMGLPMILSLSFKFFSTLYVVKLYLKMMFSDV